LISIDINTSELIKYTSKLEKLRRSSLPAAIRGALNDAAFDMKTKTLIDSSQKEFINRQSNFFKANSKFEKAQGFDVSQMKSTVGMISSGLHNAQTNYAVEDLEAQEDGGDIPKKSFIPLDESRSGKNKNKLVKPNARLSKINNVVKTKNVSGANSKVQFIKSGVFAGKGGFLLSQNILWKINSIKRLKNGNTVINKTRLYSFKQGRSVHVSGTHFMRKASLNTANKIQSFYIQQAKRQLSK
jgi:hypothetical protein